MNNSKLHYNKNPKINKTLAMENRKLKKCQNNLCDLNDNLSDSENILINDTKNILQQCPLKNKPGCNVTSISMQEELNDILNRIESSLSGQLTDDVILTYLRMLRSKFPGILIIDHITSQRILSKTSDIDDSTMQQLKNSFDVAFFFIKDSNCNYASSSTMTTAAGHWTLLCYFPNDPIFYHYDPTKMECAKRKAIKLSNALSRFLNGKYIADVQYTLTDDCDLIIAIVQTMQKIIYLQYNPPVYKNGVRLTHIEVDEMESYYFRTKLDILRIYTQEKAIEAEKIIKNLH